MLNFHVELIFQVLSRVQDFLPQLQQANEELQEKIAEGQDFNIEGISDDQPYIEMVKNNLVMNI